MAYLRNMFRRILVFNEPPKKEQFILKEDPKEDLSRETDRQQEEDHGEDEEKDKGKEAESGHSTRKNSSRRLKNQELLLKNQKPEGQTSDQEQEDEQRDEENCPRGEDKSSQKKEEDSDEQEEQAESREEKRSPGSEKEKKRKPSGGKQGKKRISKDLEDNLEYMKEVYTIPTNGDAILREFDIILGEKTVPAFILFFDGMTDRKVINDNILQPLMLLSTLDIKDPVCDIAEYVRKHLIPHNQLKETEDYQDVIDEINFGGAGLFIDGSSKAFTADVKGWEHRGVDRPNTELVIRGPQEGFNETLRVNTALIRKRMKDQNLIAENAKVGKRSKTLCSILYIKDIANSQLVDEVRRRVNGLDVDYVNDSGELEQLIEDSTLMPVPQMVATERPDRVTAMLEEGKVAVVMHGSPFVLVMPTTANELINSAEDISLRFPYGVFLKIIRLLAVLAALLLPGLYVAVTDFHQEMIPTGLLLAISESREKVPFPAVAEILIMEVSFELIREAGIRIPGPIGPTLGIIGALILGQAAVAANIVSPILIIVVAVTGIGSFAIPNYSFSFSIRLLRFAYIILGAVAGFLGITAGIFIHGLWMTSSKSFGVPFMAPYAPKTSDNPFQSIMRAPIWMQEKRPDYVNPKKTRRQKNISMTWKKSAVKEDGDEQ